MKILCNIGGFALKIFVVTKKRIALFIFYCITALFIIYFASYGVIVMTSSGKKLIPIYNVNTNENKIAITFDAAWGAQDTDEIISVLGKYNAKATFFVLGEWVDKNPDSVKAFSDAGHYIASHSNTHDSLSAMPKSAIKKQLITCNEKIEKITGTKNELFRAPSGDYNNSVIEVANELGMYTIQWNVDSLDYRGLSQDEIYNRVVKNAKSGDIILFHNDVKNTPKVLPRILESLQSKGFELVTVDELIYKDNFKINHAGTQESIELVQNRIARQKLPAIPNLI